MFASTHSSSKKRFVLFCLYLLLPTANVAQPKEFYLIHSQAQGQLKAENLQAVNSYHHDYSPQISPDGRYLLFQSDRPGYLEGHNLWISNNRNYQNPLGKADWSKPKPLFFPLPASFKLSEWYPTELDRTEALSASSYFSVNTDNFEGAFALHYANGLPKALYFSSLRKQTGLDPENGNEDRDGFAGLNIYYTFFVNQRWTTVSHLNTINSQFNDRMPSLGPRGDYMVFSSNRPGGYGSYDLWVSRYDLQSNNWSRPVNAGGMINTPYDESAPCLSPDGKLLFFSSNRPGGKGYYDLYVSRNNKQRNWQKPELLGEPFNSEDDDEYFTISHDGYWAYFSSDRQSLNRKDGFDIYRLRLPQSLHQAVDVLFTGQVLDVSSQQKMGIEATIHILFEKESRVITSKIIRNFTITDTKPKNNFETKLKSGRIYRVTFSAPGFIPQEIQLDYRGNLLAGKIDRHIIALQKLKSNTDCYNDNPTCLHKIKIYFNFNQSTILQSELSKISQVIRILQKNPRVKLSIMGHADSIGTQAYNQWLSKRRAESVFTLLKEKGIVTDRLTIQSYGFLQPAVKKETEQNRHLNRRVEFHILPVAEK